MSKLWKKPGQGPNPAIEKYTVGSDYIFDRELILFDVRASAAHAKALQKAGILTQQELERLELALRDLEKEFADGKTEIKREDEDCHTVIENYLTEKLGDLGKKIHTGRSRNDQVLVALRLYMKDRLFAIERGCAELAGRFLDFAEKYQDVAMPGYSHTQQAMLGSVGHYFSAYAESLIDDAEFLVAIRKHIDKNPLGSAAGFGTAIPVDREETTKELEFAALQINSLYCQNSRGKFESAFLEGVVQVMMTLGKFASDLILFTSREFDFFHADDSIVTGSSIMPQKRNLDVLEIMRGNLSVVVANQLAVKEISKNLISGYSRDLQLIKKPLFESVDIVLGSLEAAKIVLRGLSPKKDSIAAKIQPDIYAADIANTLVLEKGIPFRDAYSEALTTVAGHTADPKKNLASKTVVGSPGNLQIDALRKRAAMHL
ncbi:MAG: Argininosuccinate lyase [Parcubacteria group bacterium GW2011_GWA2_51_10]|nr:MAG: Argininosuccinate lyase [Parcubacteria group bacterium GW2011_GWA2_51_10]